MVEDESDRDAGAEGLPGADGRPVFTEERRTKILEIVAARGRVRIAELADLLSVTEPTVRRDVADLDRQRLLRRTHGGALAVRPAVEPALSMRATINTVAKQRIAAACAAMIDDGDSIYLDSGSTVGAIAEELTRRTSAPGTTPRNVNVVTNAFGVAVQLGDVSTIRHSMLGGQYRALGGCLVGPLAVSTMGQFTVNTAFIGVTGLSDHGFTVSDVNDAQLKNVVMDRARRVVVAMDASKVGADDFCRLCDLDRIHVIVTDRADEWLTERCTAAGVEVVLAT